MNTLSDREKELLDYLKVAAERKWGPGRNGWVRPMDIGGRNGSYHSQALAKLVRLGLAEEKRRVCSVQGAMGSNRAGKLYHYKGPIPKV